MKNKGFTLVELLAVIVILGIIALIATPIILNIIRNARNEANQRSIDMYASAVKNAIATYELKEGDSPSAIEDVEKYITYDGDPVVCATRVLYDDSKIYLTNCTVDGKEVDYEYGEYQQVYKPQYYTWIGGTIGGDKPSDAEENVEDLDTQDYTFYLGFDINEENKISAAYGCFTRNDKEYCLKRTTDGSAYEINKTVLKEAFADVENACDFDVGVYSNCSAVGLSARAFSGGSVGVFNDLAFCDVDSTGTLQCIEY